MTKYQGSTQIWTLLTSAALERKTYTYGGIAGTLGFKGGGVMVAQFLGPIMWLCEYKKYPPLTVLVVNKKTGLPGDGLSTINEVNSDREKVFNFDWLGIEPPQIKDFQDAESLLKKHN